MACSHTNTKKINAFRVCMDCGLTLSPDGKVLFDKRIVNYNAKKKKKRR